MAQQDAELEEPLGVEGEGAWQQFRAQMDGARSFWVGFVFSDWAPGVGALRRRTERLVRPRAQGVLIFRPKRPADMTTVLPMVLEAAGAPEVALTWIESLASDAAGAQDQAWTRAWEEMLLVFNARRDELTRKVRGGVVFAAPPEIRACVRFAMRELWAQRSLVLELGHHQPRAVTLSGPMLDSAITNVKPAVERMLGEGRAGEARAALLDLMEVLRAGDQRALTDAMALLAQVEVHDGDPAAAADHIELAIRTRARQGVDAVPLRWFEQAGRMALDRGDVVGAGRHYGGAEEAARVKLSRGETPDALRGLAIALIKVGDLKRDTGDPGGAGEAFEESLAVSRRLFLVRGETPDALRDLSIALERAGDARRDLDDDDGASSAYEESLGLTRRHRQLRGDTAEVLRDTALILGKIGAAHLARGALAEALKAQADRADAARKLVLTLGHRPSDPELYARCLFDLASTMRARAGQIEAQARKIEGGGAFE